MNAVDLIVEEEAWQALEDLTGLSQAAVDAASQELADKRPGGIAILLSNDAALADLNSRFRKKTGPTNVLSFPASAQVENHLGDVALAWGVMNKEAEQAGKSVEDHARHLIIHGFLHLQGYDHQNDDEAEEMEAIECRALARLGVADPYAIKAHPGETDAS